MNAIERHQHTHHELEEKKQWSMAMSNGDILPRQYQGKPANLMFAAEYADALGISRIHVLTSIAVINGRPSPSADLMSAMVRQAGHKLRVVGDDTYAEASLIRSDDPDFTYTARWDEAKARTAGLWGNKGPWKLYPAAMLRARAISEVVRMGATDVMAGGIYTPEELGAQVDADGNPVNEVVHQQATRQPQPQAEQQAPQGNSAQDRLANALGATPADDEDAGVWAERIAEANSEQELMDLYATASTNPRWDSEIKPMFTARKQDLQQFQQQEEQPEQEPLEGELLDPEAA